MKITFKDSKRIIADLNGHTIIADSSKQSGGLGEYPNPFDAFKASIGSCMAYYIMVFCLERKISLDSIKINVEFEGDAPFTYVITTIIVDERFPKNYLNAITRSTESCKIKKQFKNPPEFIIKVSENPLSE